MQDYSVKVKLSEMGNTKILPTTIGYVAECLIVPDGDFRTYTTSSKQLFDNLIRQLDEALIPYETNRLVTP